jgi:hypothetical protein
MSDTGIIAAGYQRVRDYAELVDRLLLDLKLGAAPSDETLMPVVQLLEGLENDRTASAPIHAVRLLLRSRNFLSAARFKSIAAELRSKRPTADAVADLETVAALLDDERAAMSARLQGP